MKRCKISLLAMAAGLLLLAILSGCEEGPPGPAGTPEEVVPGISAVIVVHAYDELWIMADVAIDDAPSVPSVLLDSLSASLPAEYSEGIYRFSFDDLPFSPGDSVHLLVNYIKEGGSPGEAFGDIVIPDTFQILTPPGEDYLLPLGDSLRIEWSASAGARAYRVWFYLQYNYLDTAEINQFFDFHLDTALVDTSIIFTPAVLFPDLAAMDSLLYSGGYFFARAETGPALPGDLANVSGDGQGFFNAYSEMEHLNIHVQP
ncbi:MAG TPA: hypothetical protein VF398_11125 [bacterium]